MRVGFIIAKPMAAAGLLLCGLLAPPAWAQDTHAYSLLPGLRGSPHLEVDGTYTDNLFHQVDDKQKALGLIVKPGVDLMTAQDQIHLGAGAYVEKAFYDYPGSRDDYLDWGATTNADIQATSRDRFSLHGAYTHGHDPFGTSRTESLLASNADLDEWVATELSARYFYGALGARVNLEGGVSHSEHTYVTNRDLTKFIDNESNSLDLAAFYSLTPKTAMVADFSHVSTNFNHAYPGGFKADNQEFHVRGGLRWQASAKTSGDVRVGTTYRDYDDPALPPFRHLDWRAEIRWTPVQRSTFRLASGRNSDEGYLNDVRVINLEYVSLQYQQQWTARLQGSVTIDRAWRDFIGIDRHDAVWDPSLGMRYIALANLTFFTRASVYNRSSDAGGRDYRQFEAVVGVRYNP